MLTTATPPPGPLITSPSHGDRLDPGNISITWRRVPEAESYLLTVRDLSSGTLLFHRIPLPGKRTSHTLAASLLTDGHQYQVELAAVSADGEEGWSESRPVFSVASAAPSLRATRATRSISPPQLLRPADGLRLREGDLFVEWKPVREAVAYVFELNDVTASSPRRVIHERLDRTRTLYPFYAPNYASHLVQGHNYKVSVAAVAADGSEAWTHATFHLCIKLPLPVISSPAHGARLPWDKVEVLWDRVKGAVTYRVALSDLDTKVKLIDNESHEKPPYTIPASLLTPGHEHRVAVAAIALDGTDWWAATETRFRVQEAAAVGEPVIKHPPQGFRLRKGGLTVVWDKVEGADKYLLDLLDVTGKHRLILDHEPVKGTSYELPASLLERGHDYMVVVGAVAANGAETWASTYPTFHVCLELRPPDISSPARGAQLPRKELSVIWSEVQGAASYRLTVWDLTTGQTPLHEKPVGKPPFRLPVDILHEGHEYRVSVASVAADGSPWWADSPPDFKIIRVTAPLGKPTITQPAEGFKFREGELYVAWGEVDGAQGGYLFSLHDLTTGSPIIDREPLEEPGYRLRHSDLSEEHSYRVEVIARSADGTEQPAESNPTFYVCIKLERPFISSPANGSRPPLDNLEVRWKEVPREDHYLLSLKDTSTGEQLLHHKRLEEPGYTIPREKLRVGHQYQVAVAAIAADETPWWAATETLFTVAPEEAPIHDVRVDSSQTTATVTWRTRVPSASWVEFDGVDHGRHEQRVVLENLTPSTSYEVFIRYETEKGGAPASHRVEFTTAAAAGQEPLRILSWKVTDETETIVWVRWTTNLLSDSRVTVPGVGEFKGELKGEKTQTTDHEVRVTGLRPGAEYPNTCLRSREREGAQEESISFTLKTKVVEVPPVKPVISALELREEERSDKSVVIRWKTDVPSDSWVLTSNSGHFPGNEHTTEHAVRVSGLEAGTRYTVQLRSKVREGAPLAEKSFTFTTATLQLTTFQEQDFLAELKKRLEGFPGFSARRVEPEQWRSEREGSPVLLIDGMPTAPTTRRCPVQEGNWRESYLRFAGALAGLWSLREENLELVRALEVLGITLEMVEDARKDWHACEPRASGFSEGAHSGQLSVPLAALTGLWLEQLERSAHSPLSPKPPLERAVEGVLAAIAYELLRRRLTLRCAGTLNTATLFFRVLCTNPELHAFSQVSAPIAADVSYAWSDYNKARERVREKDSLLSEALARFGPALSPEQREEYIESYKKYTYKLNEDILALIEILNTWDASHPSLADIVSKWSKADFENVLSHASVYKNEEPAARRYAEFVDSNLLLLEYHYLAMLRNDPQNTSLCDKFMEGLAQSLYPKSALVFVHDVETRPGFKEVFGQDFGVKFATMATPRTYVQLLANNPQNAQLALEEVLALLGPFVKATEPGVVVDKLLESSASIFKPVKRMDDAVSRVKGLLSKPRLVPLGLLSIIHSLVDRSASLSEEDCASATSSLFEAVPDVNWLVETSSAYVGAMSNMGKLATCASLSSSVGSIFFKSFELPLGAAASYFAVLKRLEKMQEANDAQTVALGLELANGLLTAASLAITGPVAGVLAALAAIVEGLLILIDYLSSRVKETIVKVVELDCLKSVGVPEAALEAFLEPDTEYIRELVQVREVSPLELQHVLKRVPDLIRDSGADGSLLGLMADAFSLKSSRYLSLVEAIIGGSTDIDDANKRFGCFQTEFRKHLVAMGKKFDELKESANKRKWLDVLWTYKNETPIPLVESSTTFVFNYLLKVSGVVYPR